MEKRKILIIMLLCIGILSGCGGQPPAGSQTAGNPIASEPAANEPDAEANAGETKSLPIRAAGNGYPVTVTDYVGMETVLESAPKRAAVLSATPINIWYDLGGKSVCTSTISDNVILIPEYREEIENLPGIGAVYSVNMEAIIEQNPDFVIAQHGTQAVQAGKLRDMGYPVVITYIRSFEDVIAAYAAFGKMLDNEDRANEQIRRLSETRDALVNLAPEEGKSVVILYLTASALSLKLDNSIAGDVAKALGIRNIASSLPPDTIGSENTPLDIEYIVAQNPDYVLVTSMIASNEAAVETMEQIFAENPIWKGVIAVQEGRVAYLPQEYFLYNSGPYYCEAIEYMARSVYPEIYGETGEWYANLEH